MSVVNVFIEEIIKSLVTALAIDLSNESNQLNQTTEPMNEINNESITYN